MVITKKKQKWLRLEGDKGWQIIVPDFDDKPHAVKAISKRKMELAWLDCPCKPKIDYLGKIIIHNSFIDQQRIEKSMKSLTPSN